jgi:methylmalonyl-CoA/ethylmalonyl-CoA epimerase
LNRVEKSLYDNEGRRVNVKIKRIAHIGLACKENEDVKKLYGEKLNLGLSGEEMLGELKVAFVPIGETNLELVQSTTEDGVIAKFVEKKGEGIHHVAFEVEDIDSALKELKERGVQLIDQEARSGAHNSRVAFLHPKATHGVLIELVEYPHGH